VATFDLPSAAAVSGADPEAFAASVEGEWDRLVRLARSVVGEAEAEDAVQDGLIAAWRRRSSLRDPAGFSAWLTRIVLRQCLRRFRWVRWRRFLPLEAAPEPRTAGDAGDRLGAEIDVERLLRRLAPRQRAVLHLTAVEGMSDSEIATLLGIAAGSVRAHRRRARQQIDRWMQGEGR
jgi:RNA polymerase sigma-70 factor, ECF subfamily